MGGSTMFYSFDNSNLNSKTDEELICLINNGNIEAFNFLLERYKELVNIKISKYFIIGAEREDIFQEGVIGLYKAVKSYDAEKQNSFKSFANMCIERQLITALKTSNRQKNIPLNSAFSLNTAAYEENDDVSVMDILEAKTTEDPAEMITKQ